MISASDIVNLTDFLRQIEDIIKDKINNYVDLYRVESFNKAKYTVTLTSLYTDEKIEDVFLTSISLGNEKGIVHGYESGDIVVVMTINKEYFVLGTVHNTLGLPQDEKIEVDEGSYIFQTEGGAKLKLQKDGSFKLFNSSNYGIECSSSGALTLRGVSIDMTDSPGDF